jgi:endonuclease G
MKFGKFRSIEEFLTAYQASRRAAEKAADLALSPMALKAKKKKPKKRTLAEVDATISVRLPDDTKGSKHHLLKVTLKKVVNVDSKIRKDVNDTLKNKELVLVSVRFGDRQGIEDPVPGLDEEVAVKVKGEWIPAEQAQAIGGDRLAVLHFTHDPIGFICTPAACFS